MFDSHAFSQTKGHHISQRSAQNNDFDHQFGIERFKKVGKTLLSLLKPCTDLDQARNIIHDYAYSQEQRLDDYPGLSVVHRAIIQDCVNVFQTFIHADSEARSGFSVAQALFDLAKGKERPDLQLGFYAEMIQLILGTEGQLSIRLFDDFRPDPDLTGREAAINRSYQLDQLWELADNWMCRYRHGLDPDSIQRRIERRDHILDTLGGNLDDWNDWHWQVRNVIKDPNILENLITLPEQTLKTIRDARRIKLPFGVTPFYLSLMDDDGAFDAALRAQVFPPADYVRAMHQHRGEIDYAFDFMGEHDTSPIDLITRRYPGIAILKPYNTCPQICVYCQRNWEIEDAMAPGALASPEELDKAIKWLAKHPAVHEVLVTGGDPMVLSDDRLKDLLERLCAIDHIERIRIGTRMPVTLPQRFTPELINLLGQFRRPGYRSVELVTHVQHPYEINPDMVTAIDRLKRAGIGVYNQLVFTFYTSRRFEAASLRRLLRRIGVDPYYTFNTKGKEETDSYRVPIARLLQEQKEESRLLPGLARTDEAVFNVPRLGKNHLLARQHRRLLSIAPNGSRIYEFHPWEKNIAKQQTYVGHDVPIVNYLKRLRAFGENTEDYNTIWYYF